MNIRQLAWVFKRTTTVFMTSILGGAIIYQLGIICCLVRIFWIFFFLIILYREYFNLFSISSAAFFPFHFIFNNFLYFRHSSALCEAPYTITLIILIQVFEDSILHAAELTNTKVTPMRPITDRQQTEQHSTFSQMAKIWAVIGRLVGGVLVWLDSLYT